MSTNKTVAAQPVLLARLAAAKAARQQTATANADKLRKQLEAAVGGLHTLPALEAIRGEARGSLEGDDLTAFEAEVDRLVEVRKAFEKAEGEARRLALVATTTSLEGYLDRKVQAEAKAKLEARKAKEAENKAAAKAARDAEIEGIVANMKEGKEKPLTEGDSVAIRHFLLGNEKWVFSPTPQGKNALLKAAQAASAAVRKDHKIKARAARANQEEKAKAQEEANKASAPLTHKIKA
jgi:hypothetical protein